MGWQAGEAQVSGLAQLDRDLPLLHPCWPKDELPKVTSLQRLCADIPVADGGERALRSGSMLWQRLNTAVIGKWEVSLLDEYCFLKLFSEKQLCQVWFFVLFCFLFFSVRKHSICHWTPMKALLVFLQYLLSFLELSIMTQALLCRHRLTLLTVYEKYNDLHLVKGSI